MADSRVQKTLLNARVNLMFYFAHMIMSFYSRKIFLDAMSADFMGLSTTLQGFLSVLSLVELGIGQSVGFALFKPLFDRDEKKLNEIVSVLGYLYYWVGMIILVVGVVISLFFPLIFAKESYPMLLIYVMFYSFLASTLIGYFVNYRQSLLGADQRYYIVTAYTQVSGMVAYILQVVVIYYTANPYIWIAIALASTIFSSFILNWKIRQQYPWLKASIKLGREKYKEYPEIMKKTKQLFIHRIGSFVQFELQPVIMYSFASLRAVGMYGNYSVLTSRVSGIVGQIFNGELASVGNLVAEGNQAKTLKVFFELFSVKMYIAGAMAFGLWHLTEPFISCWLGEEYVMSKLLLLLVILNCFIMQTRSVTDQFINGYGVFRDVWAPITETALSIGVAIVGGYYLGLEGVLLGAIVSMFLIVGLWKPYLLFHDGFQQSSLIYWQYYVKSIGGLVAAFAVSGALLSMLASTVGLQPSASFVAWAVYAGIAMILFGIAYYVFLYVLTQGMRDFSHRVVDIVRHRGFK